MAAKAGSFTAKNTDGIGTQDVAHGLGVVPKALIFFGVGRAPPDGLEAGCHPCFGVVGSDRQGYSIAACWPNGIASGGDYGRRIAASAYQLITQAELFAEFTISAWDATNFTVNWTQKNDASEWIISFLAIGGSHIQTKAINWLMPGGTGEFAVTGVGFRPTCVITAQIGNAAGALPQSEFTTGSANINVSATTAADQWALGSHGLDGGALAAAHRMFLTNACLASNDQTSIDWRAAFASFGNDGFTFNFSAVGATADSNAVSLCLRGLRNVKVGSFTKSISTSVPVVQSVAPGFQPEAILLASAVNVVDADTTIGVRGLFGVADGTNSSNSFFRAQHAAGTSVTGRGTVRDEAFRKVDNDTGATEAEGDFSKTANGFDITWTVNDAVATNIGFISFDSAAQGGGGGGGGGGGKPPGGGGGGGPPGGGPPGQIRRTIVGQRRLRRRGLVQIV